MDIFPKIAGSQRESSKEGLKLLLHKKKKNAKSSKEDEPRREYYLISALLGSITNIANSWLVDSGASRHMIGFREALSNYRKKKFATQVELGDDTTYKSEGVGSTSLQLDSRTILHIEDILYVPGLKKSLLFVVGLEGKGYRIIFMDKKVLLWAKNEKSSSAELIGVREEGLYKAFGHSTQALVHNTINPCELRHRRFGHLHYTS